MFTTMKNKIGDRWIPAVIAMVCVCAIMVCYSMYSCPSMGFDMSDSDLTIGILFISLAGTVLIIVYLCLVCWQKKQPRQAALQRSRVRTWCHNSIIAVACEVDYQAWLTEHERGVLAGIVPKDQKPEPVYTAFFTDNPEKKKSLGYFWTGSLKEYRELLEGCHNDHSELFVPPDPVKDGNFYPISLEKAYILIHGKDLRPLEELPCTE